MVWWDSACLRGACCVSLLGACAHLHRTAASHHSCVRISYPSSVMSTVCSAVAARPPSTVTIVHPSCHCASLVLPSTRMGSIVNVLPGSIGGDGPSCPLRSMRCLLCVTLGAVWNSCPMPCPANVSTTLKPHFRAASSQAAPMSEMCLSGPHTAMPAARHSLVASMSSRASSSGSPPTTNIADVSPWYPCRLKSVTSTLMMSPSTRGRLSGMPWTTTSLTEVQQDLGKPM
mmetsp:Transcript_26630/g.85724  ORF Transcript_26630/g.85724 Transcript_26630/m.85724 type:complete len:230 (-) Transcript_26630:30-719(-)